MANIVIFGCRKITVDVIEYILSQYPEHKITGVINHDFERDRIYGGTLVSEKCVECGIPTIRFDKSVDKDTVLSMRPDIIFSLYYRLILKQEILDIPGLGAINVHPGFLPRDRGPAPSLWNVLNGDEYAGSTMHYMLEQVDAGDIIDQDRIKVGEMTGYELNVKLMNLGTSIFERNFESIMNGNNTRAPQDHTQATYTLQFAKHLRYLSWDNPERVCRQIRAFALPFDGALAYSSGAMVIVKAGHMLQSRDSFSAPGFYQVTEDGIIVQTCTLPILITDYKVDYGTLGQRGRFKSGPPIVG